MNPGVGAATGLRFLISGPNLPEKRFIKLSQPFAVVGRTHDADIFLTSSKISFRHAYFQVIDGHVFCIDLGSKTGTFWNDQRRSCGWVRPGELVRMGSYTFECLPDGHSAENTSNGSAWPNPLKAELAASSPFPKYRLEFFDDSLREPCRSIDRRITIIGRRPSCAVHLDDSSVSRVHCALVLTTEGLWLVDLLGKHGTRLDSKIVRCGLVDNGSELTVGAYSMSVWRCDTQGTNGAENTSGLSGSPAAQTPFSHDTTRFGGGDQPSFVDLSSGSSSSAELKLPVPIELEEQTTEYSVADCAGDPALRVAGERSETEEEQDVDTAALDDLVATDSRTPAAPFSNPASNHLDWLGTLFGVEFHEETLIVSPKFSGGSFRIMQLQIETNALRKRLNDSHARGLVIDLQGLEYFGAEVFRVVVSLARQTEASGGRAVLCCATPHMQESLAKMGFDRLWKHFATREEAVAAVA